MAEKRVKISELKPDDKNFNKGTEFGNSLIEKSLRNYGAGRSILLDKNNRIIAGNKTVENAAQIGFENVIVVETTGNDIVAVKRTDIDIDSKAGRELAFADNATSKANLDWDENLLFDEFEQTQLSDWGVSLTNFENSEIDFQLPEDKNESMLKIELIFDDINQRETAYNKLVSMGYDCRLR
jgi:hypothetical protein